MEFLSATVFWEYIPQVGEPAIPLTDNSLRVCFSPEGQCESLIVSQITDKPSQISWLKKQGIPIFVDEITGIAHNKVMIIDEKTVLTGSYNWSQAANARNAENLLVLNSPEVAQTYLDNWRWRSNHWPWMRMACRSGLLLHKVQQQIALRQSRL